MPTTKAPKKRKALVKKTTSTTDPAKQCFLCHKRTKLMKTECCGQWICDDEHKYELFSFARNSCHRNHRRFTLCGYHDTEQHPGNWQDCTLCRDNFETEMYVYYGTNEYNFQKLENPPAFEPTQCVDCGVILSLGEGGYSQGPTGYRCLPCTKRNFEQNQKANRNSSPPGTILH